MNKPTFNKHFSDYLLKFTCAIDKENLDEAKRLARHALQVVTISDWVQFNIWLYF